MFHKTDISREELRHKLFFNTSFLKERIYGAITIFATNL